MGAEPIEVDGRRIVASELPAGEIAVISHVGSYDDLGHAWGEFMGGIAGTGAMTVLSHEGSGPNPERQQGPHARDAYLEEGAANSALGLVASCPSDTTIPRVAGTRGRTSRRGEVPVPARNSARRSRTPRHPPVPDLSAKADIAGS